MKGIQNIEFRRQKKSRRAGHGSEVGLLQESSAGRNQSRARQQADSGLVIGLPYPLPHGRGSVGALWRFHIICDFSLDTSYF